MIAKAIKTDKADFAKVYLNGASKLLARHHEALNSLLKYRRNGEQRVHVYDGGKAIIGNLSQGDGVNKNNMEGPHAKV